MSDVDVEIKCLSCRKDEPDSGALTKHFFSSKQSKLKVDSDFFVFVFQICFNLLSFYSGVQKGAQDVFGRHSSSNVPRGGKPFSYLILVVCHLDYIQFSNLLGGTTRSLQDQVFQKG